MINVDPLTCAFFTAGFAAHKSPITTSVMLSEALQRNAKHEARLSNISDYWLRDA
jgi:hypothetical protein